MIIENAESSICKTTKRWYSNVMPSAFLLLSAKFAIILSCPRHFHPFIIYIFQTFFYCDLCGYFFQPHHPLRRFFIPPAFEFLQRFDSRSFQRLAGFSIKTGTVTTALKRVLIAFSNPASGMGTSC